MVLNRENLAIAIAQEHVAHRACVRCVDAGYIRRAHPVFSGRPAQRILLVGQAPGPVEDDVTRPFAGRAGRQLMRWMVRAGFTDEADVRDRVYMTSMTTCFPGRNPGGTGDRRPSAAEVRLCAPWLDRALALVDPTVVIAVGALAHSRFCPRRRLEELVGRAFSIDGQEIGEAAGEAVAGNGGPGGTVVVPIPHPSGQSRWLNDPAHRVLLDRALDRLARMVARAASSVAPDTLHPRAQPPAGC